MALQFETSEVIDRLIDKVLQFYAVEHVRNHPRWDPDIELWLDSEGPLALGRSFADATSVVGLQSKEPCKLWSLNRIASLPWLSMTARP